MNSIFKKKPHARVLLFSITALLLSLKVSAQEASQTPLYDMPHIKAGYKFIEKSSTEKRDIAAHLAKQIKLLKKNGKKISILDLGAGSGEIWTFIKDTGIEVTLVDSAETQVKAAKALFKNRKGFSAIQSDSLEFMKSLSKNYDLIVAIQFLYVLPPEMQQNIVTLSQAHLSSGGMFIAVQPSRDNPLSLIKVKMLKRFKDTDYTPVRFVPDSSNHRWKRENTFSTLYIANTDIPKLGQFLADISDDARAKISQYDAITTEIFSNMLGTSPSKRWEIKLKNDYLIWTKAP